MDVWHRVDELRSSGETLVVVTVAAARGSVPCETGNKVIVTREGLVFGTVGGGKVEARAVATALGLLGTGGPCQLHTWNLQRDIGMTCGGEMTLFFELVAPAHGWHIVIFGAGHVSQALVGTLAPMRCRIDVIDEREEWLKRLPEWENVTCHRVERFEQGVTLVNSDSFVVSITKGHASDRPVLRDVFRKCPEIPFLGVIGSAAKRAVLLRELAEEGISKTMLENLVCPLGLPIGGNDPAEIAVSVAAQLLERRDSCFSPSSAQSPV